jgi:hypothetical protein
VALLFIASMPGLSYAAPAPVAGAPEATTMVGDREFALGVYHDDVGPEGARDVVGIAGRLLTSAAREPLVGHPVTLQRKLVRVPGWTDVETRETRPARGERPAGWAVFFTDIVGNARYRVAFAGDASYAGSVTDTMPVDAMRDFNARKVERGERVWLKGNINPGWEDRPVAWQKKRCRGCGWRTIDTERSGDTGRWRFRAGYPPLGDTWRFRARLKATPMFVESTSSVLVTRTLRTRGAGGRVSSLR